MPFYFPGKLHATRYEEVYQRLSLLERLMLLREFIGVTYRRRFLFFQDQPVSTPFAFRRNLAIAADRQFRRLVISRRIWRHHEVLRPYLNLIFRHFLFGFLVQSFRRAHLAQLMPAPAPGSYYDFFPNLLSLLWFNRHRDRCQAVIDQLLTQVIDDSQRSLYVFALLTISRFHEIFAPSFEEIESLAAQVRACSRPGGTPLGIELEFSNLGRFATFDAPFKSGCSDPLFQNMKFYEAFYLDDVSWRLGGYLDTHIRGLNLLSLPRITAQPGGFYEYSMVRLDYPYSFSMPLSQDPGLVALYIEEAIDFVSEIKPHSLHINIEKTGLGHCRPELTDYLCLLLLGGDLERDERGRWRERRLADNELRGVIQRRKHRPAAGAKAKEVVEYSFLRLWRPGQRDYGYLPVLMACKGFQFGYNMELSCRDQVQAMMAWAHDPQPLAKTAIDHFVENLARGWEREGAHPRELRQQVAGELRSILERRNAMLE
ncbi:MAG TPA: hypothetical protein ENN66_04980 [Proteobacteria bacterium]|nr:hypothetical protein [Pseudomonadota bacterium]